jgi:hypothetical protein
MVQLYSQAGQDFFVLSLLNYKQNGTFLEIGSQDGKKNNNTYLLEKSYNWRGILVEIDPSFIESYKEHRPNSVYLIQDATKINYKEEFEKTNMPHDLDYLQIDLEIFDRSTLTVLEIIEKQLFSHYRFATVTFEHDIYRDRSLGHNTRQKSREIFERNGYVRIFSDVADSGNPFEDWYVHPELVDMSRVLKVKREESMEWRDILKHLEKL